MAYINFNKVNEVDFVYLTENKSAIIDKLQEETDIFRINSSSELEQMRIVFTYFIEFLTQEKLNNNITTP